MGNPAREIADYLNGHNKKVNGQSVYDARGSKEKTGPRDYDFWAMQGRLVGLAADLSAMLVEMEANGIKVVHHRRSLRDAFRAIFVPDTDWTALVGNMELISEPAIDNLYALAESIDAFRKGPLLTNEDRESVTKGVDDLLELLRTGNLGLDQAESAYFLRLLEEIRNIASEAEVFASIDLPRRINELRGYLAGLMLQMDDTEESAVKKDVIRTALMRIGMITYGAAGLGFQVLGAVADFQQITGTTPGS